MTGPEKRQIAAACRDIVVNGRIEDGVAAICRVARIDVPTAPAGRFDPIEPRTPHVKKVAGCGCGYCQDGQPVSLAKRKRIEDRWALAVYLHYHPLCENGCGKPATVVHHLRGKKSDDVESELAALCGGKYNRDGTLALDDPENCHTGNNGFHPLGGKRWFKTFNHRWTAEFQVKVMRALRI